MGDTCKTCHNDKQEANGCKPEPIAIGGNKWPHLTATIKDCGGPRCKECHCKPGNYHHAGCTKEKCPVCGNYLATCNCLKPAATAYPNNKNTHTHTAPCL